MLRSLVISYRRLGTTYRSHLQGSCSHGYPETSVNNYQSTLRNILEEYFLIDTAAEAQNQHKIILLPRLQVVKKYWSFEVNIYDFLTYVLMCGLPDSCLQTCMTYTIAECTVNKLLMMDRGTVRNM